MTPDEHADLFWGVRGGKSALGIVTEVEIDLLPIAEFYGGAVYFDGADAARVLHAWREWGQGLPESVNTSLAVQQLPPLPGVPEPLAGRLTVAVRYTALGDIAEARRLLEPMRAAATALMDTVGVLPYAAIGAVHADPVDPMPLHEDHALLRGADRGGGRGDPGLGRARVGFAADDRRTAAARRGAGPRAAAPQRVLPSRRRVRVVRHRRSGATGRRECDRSRCRSGRCAGAVVDGRADAQFRGIRRSGQASALLHRGHPALAGRARGTVRPRRRTALSTGFGLRQRLR